jgi:hypothetical protein
VFLSESEFRGASIKSKEPIQLEQAGKMAFYKNYIFVNDLDKGILVIDNSSPVKNTMLFKGQTPKEFAPEYAKQITEEEFDKRVNEVLEKEGQAIYNRISWDQTNVTRAYKEKKAYMENIANIEAAKKSVNKALGREE